MSRHHIFTVVVFIALAAAIGLTYQFYFKEKIEAYNAAEAEKTRLEGRLKELSGTFGNERPHEYVRARKEQVAPLQQAEAIRAQYFNLRDLWLDEQIPEGQESLIKFYYGDKYKEKLADLQQKAFTRAPQPMVLPADPLRAYLNVPAPAELTNQAVNKDDVQRWLTEINFGSNMLKMLADANVYAVSQFVVWPPRMEFNNLRMRTIGLQIMLRAEDLVSFVEGLQRANRYYNVNAIRIQNPNLIWQYGSPYLQVEMLLTVAEYVQNPGVGAVPASTTPSTGLGLASTNFTFGPLSSGGGLQSGTATARTQQRSWWQKLWPF